MGRMKTGWLLMLLLLTGCAMITVNVYFPKEEVAAAFDRAEDEWMNQTAEVPVAPQSVAPATPVVGTGGRSTAPSFSLLATPAEAADEVSNLNFTREELWRKLRVMPEVAQAFRARGEREKVIDGLLNLGLLGLSADGLVALLPLRHRPAEALDGARDLLLINDTTATDAMATPEYVLDWVQQLVAVECRDRNIVITGMGQAMFALMLEENSQLDPDDQALQTSFIMQARKTFAERQVARAPGNWWLQLPDNTWSLKNPPPPPPAAE